MMPILGFGVVNYEKNFVGSFEVILLSKTS